MKLYIQTAPARRVYLPHQARTRPELMIQGKDACITHEGKRYPVSDVQAEARQFTLATSLWIIGMGAAGVLAGDLFASSLPLLSCLLTFVFLVAGICIAGWRQTKEDRRVEIFNRSQVHTDYDAPQAQAA